jgi:P-type conjugative transfer protein TrbJ
MERSRSTLAAKATLALAAAIATTVFSAPPALAGIPVIDGGNLVQNIMQAVQQVAAVEKQIQQYQTQLQQYQNMLQNSLAPAAYIWDQANQTINKLLAAQDTLAYYKRQAGSIDSYLSRYKDISYYRTSPCFTAGGTCTAQQRQALLDARANNSEAVKQANDAVIKGVNDQQKTLQAEANNLRRLQSQAAGAQGQMEALQAANQLASAQTNQLLQIRGLLVAQQVAEATRDEADRDRQAQQAAAAQSIRNTSNITHSQAKSWEFH